MKVAKEQMSAMVEAVDWFLSQSGPLASRQSFGGGPTALPRSSRTSHVESGSGHAALANHIRIDAAVDPEKLKMGRAM